MTKDKFERDKDPIKISIDWMLSFPDEDVLKYVEDNEGGKRFTALEIRAHLQKLKRQGHIWLPWQGKKVE